MNKITELRYVGNLSSELLEEAINSLIDNGWQPYGSPVIYEELMIQTMVKYECEHVWNTNTEKFKCYKCGRSAQEEKK